MPANPTRRKVLSIALGTCFIVLLLALATLNAFNSPKLPHPVNLEQIFVFTGLSVVAFLLFIVVLVLLVRNTLKLYTDQRSRVLGAHLRTRMLWGAVLVSLVPIVFMFAFSYLLMNRAVDRWFSQPVTQMREDSNRMALALAQYSSTNARVEADSIAASIAAASAQRATNAGRRLSAEVLSRILQQHEITLQNGFAVIYLDGHAAASFHVPQGHGTAEVKPWLPGPQTEEGSSAANHEPVTNGADAAILAAARRSDSPVFSVGQMDYALAAADVQPGNTVVVGLPMPAGMAATMARLRQEADSYWVLFRERRQIRNLYMSLLLMMTILALFASTWLALHISKQVTRPVEALGDAMEAIAAGDYAHRVDESSTEELGELVRSFNHMAADLEGSRRAVERSTIELSAANTALEARRSELETMLETIPNGVATLDAARRIVLTNRALSEMMDPGGQRPFLGHSVEEVFPPEVAEVIDPLIKRSHRMGSASSEIEVAGGERLGGSLNLLATVALLETPGRGGQNREHRGYVLVLENATELLRAQKQSAWKEVARRVAHEIKNPLTPISLSAEQIHRHIDRVAAALAGCGIDLPSPAVIRRCSEAISSSVESMRLLVDQFAALAEFPAAHPRPADLNTIVDNALALFAGRLQNIAIIKKMSSGLPLVMADPEALKRALSNVVDNAAEAMQRSLLRELRISTALLENGMVELSIADTGTGLTDEMRERLFLPYFSTKQRGTGLGLAIAAKIIQEHQGSIRAEKNFPAGAKFIIELKVAAVSEPSSATAATANGHGGPA